MLYLPLDPRDRNVFNSPGHTSKDKQAKRGHHDSYQANYLEIGQIMNNEVQSSIADEDLQIDVKDNNMPTKDLVSSENSDGENIILPMIQDSSEKGEVLSNNDSEGLSVECLEVLTNLNRNICNICKHPTFSVRKGVTIMENNFLKDLFKMFFGVEHSH